MTVNRERFQGAAGSGGLFLGWADGDVVAVRTGNCARDENHTIFWADGDDFKILYGGTGGSHVTGHLLVLPNATWGRAATDGASTAMHHGAVGHFQTTEAVTFDRTLETAALGFAEHVDPLANGEGIETGMDGWEFHAIFDAKFLDKTLGCTTGFLGNAESWLGGTLFLLVTIADLDCGVAVGFRSLGLKNRVTRNVDDGDRDHGARLLIEQASHTDFFAEEAE